MIVALPAILAAFLMLFTTQEPERGATEDALKVGALSAIVQVWHLDAMGCSVQYAGHASHRRRIAGLAQQELKCPKQHCV